MKKIFGALILSAALLLTACGSNVGTDSSDGNDIVNTNNDSKVFDSSTDGDMVTQMSIEYNGKTVNLPCTVSELTAIGLVGDDSSLSREIEVDLFNVGGDTLLTEDGDYINVIAYNKSGSPAALNDCIVTEFSTGSDDIVINGVTSGKDTFDDVISRFGKDSDTREDSAKKDLESKGALFALNYMVDSYSKNGYDMEYVSFSCSLSEGGDLPLGTVEGVSISYSFVD